MGDLHDEIQNLKEEIEKQFDEDIQNLKEKLELRGYIVTEEGLKKQLEEKGTIDKGSLYRRYPYESLKLVEVAPNRYGWGLKETSKIIGDFPYEDLKLVEVAPNRFVWNRRKPHRLFTERDWEELSYEGLLRTMLQKKS